MGRTKTERIGTKHYNRIGELFIVIDYQNSKHVTVEFQDKYKGVTTVQWAQIENQTVRNPNEELTGLYLRTTKYIDLTGRIFGRLKVIGIAHDAKNTNDIKWLCECSCDDHTIIEVKGSLLKEGGRKSCGCLIKEQNMKRKKQLLGKRKYENKYDLTNEYGIGYCINTNNPFYFDLEDYDLISQYTWSQSGDYVVTSSYPYNKKNMLLHRLIMNVSDPTIEVDHIGHNTFDNRKTKLRISSKNGNHQNLKLAKNNKSGVTGVCWEKQSQKWHAYIYGIMESAYL